MITFSNVMIVALPVEVNKALCVVDGRNLADQIQQKFKAALKGQANLRTKLAVIGHIRQSVNSDEVTSLVRKHAQTSEKFKTNIVAVLVHYLNTHSVSSSLQSSFDTDDIQTILGLNSVTTLDPSSGRSAASEMSQPTGIFQGLEPKDFIKLKPLEGKLFIACQSSDGESFNPLGLLRLVKVYERNLYFNSRPDIHSDLKSVPTNDLTGIRLYCPSIMNHLDLKTLVDNILEARNAFKFDNARDVEFINGECTRGHTNTNASYQIFCIRDRDTYEVGRWMQEKFSPFKITKVESGSIYYTQKRGDPKELKLDDRHLVFKRVS